MGVSRSGRKGIGASNGCLGARVLGCLGCQLEIVRRAERNQIFWWCVVGSAERWGQAEAASGDRDRDRAVAAWTGDDANLGTKE